MNIFGDLFRVLVYEPQLNLLYFFFKITNGDIGISIILLAVVVNLIILPLFAKSYINMQKTRILQPRIKAIQTQYKDNPQLMLQKLTEFNKKHGISNSYTFLVLFVQLFFVSGLYILIKDVVDGKEIKGLYSFLQENGSNIANFKDNGGQILAFGAINVGANALEFIWIPLITMFLSYIYGMYTFRWAPKVELPKLKDEKVKKENVSGLDPETMQKSMEFQSIYVMPVFLFIIQYTLPTGLNIYFAISSLFSLVRQIFLTNFYSKHTDRLIAEISESDPTHLDGTAPIVDLKSEDRVEPEILASQSVPTALVGSSKKSKNRKKK